MVIQKLYGGSAGFSYNILQAVGGLLGMEHKRTTSGEGCFLKCSLELRVGFVRQSQSGSNLVNFEGMDTSRQTNRAERLLERKRGEPLTEVIRKKGNSAKETVYVCPFRKSLAFGTPYVRIGVPEPLGPRAVDSCALPCTSPEHVVGVGVHVMEPGYSYEASAIENLAMGSGKFRPDFFYKSSAQSQVA